MPVGPKFTADDFSNFTDDDLNAALVGLVQEQQRRFGDSFAIAFLTLMVHTICALAFRTAPDDHPANLMVS